MRELTYKEGEEYSNKAIDDTRTRLLNLHLFSAVTFNPDLESAAREIPIDLNVRERPSVTSASAAATAPRTISAPGAWNDYNWLGDGRQALGTMRYARSTARVEHRCASHISSVSRDLEGSDYRGTARGRRADFHPQSEAIIPQLTWHITEQLSRHLRLSLMYANLSSVSRPSDMRWTDFAARELSADRSRA